MKKIICALILATATTTCKLAEDMNAGNLTSFRRDDKGNVTVAVGIFMNRYPSVVDGEFFPFELYDEEVAELEEGEFKGFAADVITGKHPFEGFKNHDAVEKAKARSPQDPYHFDGYYLKIMVVNDAIEALPDEVYLHRGFFPHNFYCPAGQESVEIKADDNALGDPQGDNVLGSPSWAARAARAVTFCKTKEVNGPYAGRDFYYTRVSLFAQDTYHINELNDNLSLDRMFENLDSQYHETISARGSFHYKDGGKFFTEAATIVNLNYNVTPAVLEMHELLRQSSTVDLAAIISSTDEVQHYLHDNRKRAHDANWQVLLLAQRKWLAIRMILEDMGRQQDNKAEQLRVGILTSLEMADVRDMLPLAEKLAEYRSAADYINELRRNPAATVNDSVAKELFFSATSHKHFNRIIYHTAITSTIQQWFSSRGLYNWVSSLHDFSNACNQFCPVQEKAQIEDMIVKMQEHYVKLAPLSRQNVHDAWMMYVSAVNKIYPDPHTARAAFKKKYVVAGNTIDYENSSQKYKDQYRGYSRRYDLVFGEPHGLLMGTEVFLQQMGEKRKPEDVFIVSRNGELQYDWKMHPHVQFATVDTAIGEMLDGIYLQAEQLHKIAKKIHQHEPNARQQIKLTSDFSDHYQILPIAKALLVRPDYARRMNEVFDKYTRFRPVGFFSKWVLGAVTVAATVAALALSIPTLGTSLALPLPSILIATAGASGLISSAAQFQYGRVVQQRAENSLFADNLGTNFEEYHLVRQQYLQARRDLYITAAFTVFDAAEFVRMSYLIGKSARHIKAMKSVLSTKAVGQYSGVFEQLKYCSAPSCRKFIQSVPLMTANADNTADLTSILKSLKKASTSGEFKHFKDAVESLWMQNNTGGVFNKVIKAGFVDDVVRSRFLPFSDVRIPSTFTPPKLMGISSARKAAMVQLLDENAVKNMGDKEVLELFGNLVYGRRYKKRLIFANRDVKRQQKLLGKKLGMSNKELQQLYVGKYKGKDGRLPKNNPNVAIKKMIDDVKSKNMFTNKAAKKKLQTWLQARRTAIGRGRVELRDAENFIELYKNEQRVTALRADFGAMVGKIAKFDKKRLKPDAGGVVEPGLISRPASRLLGLKKDVVEQVADSGKWQKIFKDNPKLKEELLLGKVIGGVKQKSELRNMLDNLNDIFERAFIAYQRKMSPQPSVVDEVIDAVIDTVSPI